MKTGMEWLGTAALLGTFSLAYSAANVQPARVGITIPSGCKDWPIIAPLRQPDNNTSWRSLDEMPTAQRSSCSPMTGGGRTASALALEPGSAPFR